MCDPEGGEVGINLFLPQHKEKVRRVRHALTLRLQCHLV